MLDISSYGNEGKNYAASYKIPIINFQFITGHTYGSARARAPGPASGKSGLLSNFGGGKANPFNLHDRSKFKCLTAGLRPSAPAGTKCTYFQLRPENAHRSYFSLSPSHLETKSDEDILKNFELLASVATALAKYDFPVPGGLNCDNLSTKNLRNFDLKYLKCVRRHQRELIRNGEEYQYFWTIRFDGAAAFNSNSMCVIFYTKRPQNAFTVHVCKVFEHNSLSPVATSVESSMKMQMWANDLDMQHQVYRRIVLSHDKIAKCRADVADCCQLLPTVTDCQRQKL
uniref:Uncharacterized protein n=1 Tax=Romanomermis culicivorax TaxID=13658 RepID=A0A915KKS2_ROMCU